MNNQNKSDGLNECTREYLQTYYDILDRMIRGMTEAELDESISHNFIVTMIPHHMAAIEMSQNILNYTNVKQLRSIAENIISEQTQSIKNMQDIFEECTERTNNPRELCQYQSKTDEIIQTMFTQMRTARTDNRIDCNFMREMIPHHRGAVRMSSNALRFRICPELKPILNAIIISQKRGIMQMQNLMRMLNCQ